MDPTVITAAIGVGGTVIVGVVGFWSTKTASDKAAQVATDNTARALDAARDERIWDRRARAYEQSVAALLYRRQQRRQELAELVALPAAGLRPLGRTYALWQEQVSLPDHPFFDRYPSGWFEVEGTLLAYATPKVITALDAARQADDAARIALGRCRKLSGKGIALDDLLKDSDASPEEARKPDANAQAELEAAAKALWSALGEAEQKDNHLIDAIRDDLDAKPSQARQPAK
jgi:hypothetical protein